MWGQPHIFYIEIRTQFWYNTINRGDKYGRKVKCD